MTSTTRYLIVNADDLGMSTGVNEGIFEAHQRGIVTSSSLMVCLPAARSVATYARQHPEFAVGLHIDLGEWTYRDEEWVPLYTRGTAEDAAQVRDEIVGQLALFQKLIGRDPTHLDSHQHVHEDEPARSVALDIARTLGVPLRGCTPHIRYCGDFYGQTAEGEYMPGVLTLEGLSKILASLPAGTTELGCHPGCSYDLDSPYRHERDEELNVLCDPRLPDVLKSEAIVLRSFGDAPLS